MKLLAFIRDVGMWMFIFIFILTGAARAAFDGAFFAYFRPQWEQLLEQLPAFIKWFIT